MLTKLSDTAALYPLGHATGQRLLRLPSGPYAGRLVALYLDAAGHLAMRWRNSGASTWSTPITIATDIADLSYDSCIADDCSIHIAYLDSDGVTLKSRALSYANGAWTIGDPVIVYNAHSTLNSSLVIDSTGTLWLAFNRLVNGNWFVQLKSSVDSGATWGTGQTDPGETLSTGASQLTAKLIAAAETLHAIIAYGSTKIVSRAMPYSTAIWSDEYIIASGLSGFSHQFDAALGPNGRIAVAYNDSAFRVREFDGLAWGAAVTLESSVQQSPQVVFRNSIPTILWLRGFNYEQRRLMFSSRRSGDWSAPAPLDPRADLFDSVILYNHGAGTYVDRTAAASDLTESDSSHPASGALFKNPGDALYVGMNSRFRYLHAVLSPVGSGGTVTFSFWNGFLWVPFTPSSGQSDFDSTPARIALWPDYQSIPLDWQKRIVTNQIRYWIKIEVNSGFTTGPIGSQISAVSELQTLIVRR